MRFLLPFPLGSLKASSEVPKAAAVVAAAAAATASASPPPSAPSPSPSPSPSRPPLDSFDTTTTFLGGLSGMHAWPHARSAKTKSGNDSEACSTRNGSRERSRSGSLRGAKSPRVRQEARS